MALHEAENNQASALAVVTAAVEHWTKKKDELNTRETVLREGAQYMMRHHKYEQAAGAFEELLKQKKDDPYVVAGLVQVRGRA